MIMRDVWKLFSVNKSSAIVAGDKKSTRQLVIASEI